MIVDRKVQWRKQLASLSFSEKIKILERLRHRSITIAASGLRQRKAIATGNSKLET